MTTWITICDTCMHEGRKEVGPEGTDGERLAGLIEARVAGEEVRTRRFSCLMGCTRGCNVAIQAPGKLAYTLGLLRPDAAAAEAVLAYARLHAQSGSGQVPYRQWPEAIKGHFMTRHPPLPEGPDGG